MNLYEILFIIIYGLVVIFYVWYIVNKSSVVYEKTDSGTQTAPLVPLHFALQNFGVVKDKNQIYLDDNNSALNTFSGYDIVAFQELLIPSSRFDPKLGKGRVDIFNPIVNMRMEYVFASIVTTVKLSSKDYHKCFGLIVNPNLNLVVNKYENIIDTKTNKGFLVVEGTLFGRSVVIASVHLIWNLTNGGFKNPQNPELMVNLLNYIKNAKVDNYIILGDFNMSFSFIKNHLDEWRKILPDMKTEVDQLSGSLVTSYDADGFAHPDHIISNLNINTFRTKLHTYTDHMCMEGILDAPVAINQRLKANKRLNFKEENL